MPIELQTLSFSQFGELMGVDPKRLIDVLVDRKSGNVTILLEPEDDTDHRNIPAVGGQHHAA